MLSPAKASFHRKLAAAASGVASATGAAPMPEVGPVAQQYQMLLMSLGQDLRRLSNIQETERKIEAKRSMIATYRPWIEGALQGDGGAQDEIVSTMLVWAIDLAEWPLAIDLATYVLTHGIALPERYKRQPAVLIAEEFAEAGLVTPPTVDLATLQFIDALTEDCDMHDQVRAKLAKALGLALKARADTFDPEADSAMAGGRGKIIEAAIAQFNRALSKDSKVGAKKLIEGLERDLKKLTEEKPA
jgi:hypothetical protein